MAEILGIHCEHGVFITKELIRVSDTSLHLTSDFNVLWALKEDADNTCAIVSSFTLIRITPFFLEVGINRLYIYIKPEEQYEALYFLQSHIAYIKHISVSDPRLHKIVAASEWVDYLIAAEKSRKSEAIRLRALCLLKDYQSRHVEMISINDFFVEYQRVFNDHKITKDWLLRALSKKTIRVDQIHIPATNKEARATSRLNWSRKLQRYESKGTPKRGKNKK